MTRVERRANVGEDLFGGYAVSKAILAIVLLFVFALLPAAVLSPLRSRHLRSLRAVHTQLDILSHFDGESVRTTGVQPEAAPFVIDGAVTD